MTPHRPEIHYVRRIDERWTATCRVCSEASAPTLHKPNAEAWAKQHIKEATR
jgi:hypothetical protein